jgi:hypothetical protein
MSDRWLGIVVVSEKVMAVDAEVPDVGPLVIQADHTWNLQDGERAEAYRIMHQHIADYVRESRIKKVVIKASALSMGSTKMVHLEAAELRGVVAGAAASSAPTVFIAKAHMSRTFGKRKVDDYVKDNEFWNTEVSGKPVRIGSREAAMVLLAARKNK